MDAAPRRLLSLEEGLWIAQAVLALVFGVGGLSVLTRPVADLTFDQGWAALVPASLVRPLGAVELTTAWLLFAPALTRIAPWLTQIVAAVAALVTTGCAVAHVAHGQVLVAAGTITLAGLCAFVAWGRSGPAIIPSHAYLK